MLSRIIYCLNQTSLKHYKLGTLLSKFLFRDNVRHKVKGTQFIMLTKHYVLTIK